MAFEIRPYPEWSWSQSREQTFSECARKYYYHYYGSHNGWLRDAPLEARTAYRLKQMTNLYLILGDAIHQMAEASVKQWQLEKALPDTQQMTEKIRGLMNQAFLDSRKPSDWMAAPKKLIMLHEMYYDGKLPEQRVEQIKERMSVCVQQFFMSASLRDLTEDIDAKIMEVEELNTFYVDDVKIYVKLDLLYRTKDDTWVIVDWKTGKESDKNEQQVLLYALFLHDKYQVPLDQVEIRIEYLLNGDYTSVTVRLEDVERVKQDVLQSSEAMKSFLESPSENKPMPVTAFPVSPERRKCGGCNFREICDEKLI